MVDTNNLVASASGTITSPVDGLPPIYDEEGRFQIWKLSQVYVGREGLRRYVPNVGDYIIDTDANEWYVSIHLDKTTMITTFDKLPKVGSGDLTEMDLLLGVGPGTQADTYRIYIDSSVRPPILTVDARLTIAGTENVTAMIFLGSDLTADAEILGIMYDPQGNVLGHSLPLELVYMNGGINYAIKSIPTCYATRDVKDGEVATVVFYSAAGFVRSKRQCLVENTGVIRGPDASKKYVVGIELQSPWMSTSNPNVLEYPMNVPLNGMNLFGVVHYSDGSWQRREVDGTKFRLDGLEEYVSTQIGQSMPLVLQYTLSPGEVVYGPEVRNPGVVPRDYRAVTTKAEGQYTVKLFGYPVWIDAVNGYRLEWFLYNLDRKTYSKCTGNVRIDENGPAWNPLGYGTNQQLRATVNLQDVNGIYKDYIHVQTISIILLRPAPDTDGANWTIGFDPGQNPPFGRNTKAITRFVNTDLNVVRLDAATNDYKTWLDRVFYDTRPLKDPSKEAFAPEPNMFAILVDGITTEFPISQWNGDLQVNRAILDASTLFVRFFKRTVENDIELGITGFAVHQTLP